MINATQDATTVRTLAGRGGAVAALSLVVPMAAVGEGAALWLWPGSAPGITLYWLAKVWLVALPAVWTKRIDQEPWSWSPARRGGFAPAIVLGLLAGAVIVGAYAVALHNHWIDIGKMRAMAARNYLHVFWVYLAFVLVISTSNALMEEYVWRWFVFRKWETLVGGRLAVVLAAFCFTLHHSAALKLYFDWRITLLGSAGVFTGGLLWSALYLRYRSVWPGFVSHIIVDFAMFAVGWHLIFVA